jgi:DNA polymerase-3 subunit epsilon
MSTFLAIDFETANYYRDSACAVGLTLVRGGRVIKSEQYLIRPPSRWFTFTYIHNLTWEDVCAAPTFDQVWPAFHAKLTEVDFVAAHNASFDRGVLEACCGRYGLESPETPFVCTVQVARAQWGIFPTKLPDVCRHLDIPLDHHNAGSDAEACARIVLEAQRHGWAL